MTAVAESPIAQEQERARNATIARRKRLLRRGRGCAVWFVVLAIVAGLGTWFFVTMFVHADQRAGEQALAEARASGAPLKMSELAALPPRSPQIDQATKLWRRAMEKIDLQVFTDREYWEIPILGPNRTDEGSDPPDRDDRGHLQGEDLKAAKLFLAQFDEALDAARSAREAGAVANFSATADGQSVNYINPYPLNYLGSILRLRAETRLAGGDLEGAVDDLATMLAVGDAFRFEPYERQQRVRLQALDSAVDLLERMLAVEDLNDDQLRRLAEVFVERDEAASFRLALAGSRANFVELLQRNDQAFQDMMRIERSSWTRGADLATGLDIFRRMDEAGERDLIEAIDAWKPIEAELATLGAEPLAQTRYPGTLMLLPQLGPLAQSHLQAEASLALARTAIACERYRLKHDKLPTKLADLTPDFLDQVPLDPCDGQPLRYLSDANGVRLYSIGADLVDHGGGGAASSGAAMFAPSDIVFRLKKTRAKDAPSQP